MSYAKQQKNAIDKLVQEYLATGIIQNSSSPFARPIVLVGKKDGSWRLCVDYKDLNKHTVKNKFPIPLLDDLLDELADSSIFILQVNKVDYIDLPIASTVMQKDIEATNKIA